MIFRLNVLHVCQRTGRKCKAFRQDWVQRTDRNLGLCSERSIECEDDGWVMNWKMYGENQSRRTLNCYTGICLWGLRKTTGNLSPGPRYESGTSGVSIGCRLPADRLQCPIRFVGAVCYCYCYCYCCCYCYCYLRHVTVCVCVHEPCSELLLDIS
jgi:hypothetical protein